MFNKNIASLRVVLAADISKFRRGMKQAGAQMKTTGAKLKGFAAGMSTLLPAAAAAAGAALFMLIKRTAQWGDTIAKSAKQTGLTAEFLSEMEFAATRAGASLSDVMNGIRRMARAASDANRGMVTYQRAFNELGITVTDTNGNLKETEELFMEVTKALGGMENATKRMAIAQEIFGRGGMKLLPLVDEDIDALRARLGELGGVLSNETARSSEKFVDAMTDVKAALRGVTIEIMERVGPAMTWFMNHLAEDIPKYLGKNTKRNMEEYMRGVGGLDKEPSKDWDDTFGLPPEMVQEWNDLAAAINRAGTAAIDVAATNAFAGPMPTASQMMPTDVDTHVSFTSVIERKILNKALGQTERLHHSLTQIDTDFAEIGETVIVSAEKIQEWSDQAARAAGHVTEGVYMLFDALDGDNFWESLYQNAKRYFQMLIAESIRSRAYAWFLGQFSGGNVAVGSGGGPMPTGNPFGTAPSGGGTMNVTLVNNSGMPMDATASTSPNGDLTVILEGPVKQLFNSGRMDGTMRQYGAYRVVG